MRPNIKIQGNNNTVHVPKTKKLTGHWGLRKRIFIYSTVILATLVIGGMLYSTLFMTTYINDQLYTQYFEPFDAKIDNSSNNVQAHQCYQREKYVDAIKYFEELGKSDSLTTSDHFYFAISYCAIHKYYKAIEILEPLALNKDCTYRNNVSWYLALCYLKIDDNNRAIDQFEKLVKIKNPYRREALQVLEKIQDNTND